MWSLNSNLFWFNFLFLTRICNIPTIKMWTFNFRWWMLYTCDAGLLNFVVEWNISNSTLNRRLQNVCGISGVQMLFSSWPADDDREIRQGHLSFENYIRLVSPISWSLFDVWFFSKDTFQCVFNNHQKRN